MHLGKPARRKHNSLVNVQCDGSSVRRLSLFLSHVGGPVAMGLHNDSAVPSLYAEMDISRRHQWDLPTTDPARPRI